AGSRKIYNKDQICCWTCEACAKNQIVVNEVQCIDCGQLKWPEKEFRNQCSVVQPTYIRLGSGYAIIPMVFSGLGIICTFVVAITFYRFRETPIVKACGREMSCIILSGCMICYLMTFVLIATPTMLTCALQRLGIGVGLAAMYASMLTKTNRLSRIFDAAKRTIKRPPFISPKSQLILCGTLVGLQVLLTTVWFIYDPPGTTNEILNGNEGTFVVQCKQDWKSFLNLLIYNIILIAVCTVYAIKTRHIPENFNESKFIGFTMYTTCVIWLAFIAIYFTTLH
ncbi:Metabotropic glutamate receptor 3, partial [Cichlidogyrus casuarinus]